MGNIFGLGLCRFKESKISNIHNHRSKSVFLWGKNINKGIFLDLFKIFKTLSKEQSEAWCKFNEDLVVDMNKSVMNQRAHRYKTNVHEFAYVSWYC